MGDERPPIGLRRPAVVAVVATVALVVSWLIASRRPIPTWEQSLTSTINDSPGWLAVVLWPVMQLGTVFAPIGAAVIVALLRRDRLLAVATLAAGVGAWFAAKAVKEVVERGRPRQYLPSIHVREGTGTGLGYVSGHGAVAAACVVCVMAALPAKWRPWLAVVAVIVGTSRIVYGVHLPADVVGGWALGTLVGLLALGLTDRVRATG